MYIVFADSYEAERAFKFWNLEGKAYYANFDGYENAIYIPLKRRY